MSDSYVGAISLSDSNPLDEIEAWRPVVDYPDYEISDMGRVRCIVDRKGFAKAPFFPAVNMTSTGRPVVTLRNESRQKLRRVDELVLEAFTGPRPAPDYGPVPTNGDRRDVRADNLSWVAGIARVPRTKKIRAKRIRAKRPAPATKISNEIKHGHWLGTGNVVVSIQPNSVVELTVADSQDHHNIPISDLNDVIRVLQAAKTIIDG